MFWHRVFGEKISIYFYWIVQNLPPKCCVVNELNGKNIRSKWASYVRGALGSVRSARTSLRHILNTSSQGGTSRTRSAEDKHADFPPQQTTVGRVSRSRRARPPRRSPHRPAPPTETLSVPLRLHSSRRRRRAAFRCSASEPGMWVTGRKRSLMTLSASARFAYFSDTGILTKVSLVPPPPSPHFHCQTSHQVTHTPPVTVFPTWFPTPKGLF